MPEQSSDVVTTIQELPEPVLYDESAEPEAISEELPEPVLHDEAAQVEAISVDEPQPVLIAEQEPTAANSFPTWGWILIIAGAAALAATITYSIVNKRTKATS